MPTNFSLTPGDMNISNSPLSHTEFAHLEFARADDVYAFDWSQQLRIKLLHVERSALVVAWRFPGKFVPFVVFGAFAQKMISWVWVLKQYLDKFFYLTKHRIILTMNEVIGACHYSFRWQLRSLRYANADLLHSYRDRLEK